MDELQRELAANSKRIVSKGYGPGTEERGFFALNKETHKLEPIEEMQRIEVNAPFVITDEIAPTQSMTGTDKIHTSKATLRREYKEQGFIETGGQKVRAAPLDREKRFRDIRETVQKNMNDLKYNNVPIDEMSREVNLREEREWQAYLKRQKA